MSSATPDLLRLSYSEFTGLKCELYWDGILLYRFLPKVSFEVTSI